MQQSLADIRRRHLLILGAVAAVLVVLAVLALWRQNEQFAPTAQRSPMFPNLPHQASMVTHVHIATKKGAFDVVKKPGKGWVIASRGDVPASFAQVNKTVVGLATLETLEAKTARADWLRDLDLDAPPKGNGVLISLSDDKGQTLAAVITGKGEDIGDQTGGGGLYVRKPDSTQSWLAKSTFEPKGDIADWYDKSLIDLDRARIAETDVTPVGSPAYTVKRAKPGDANFQVANLPSGRELPYPGAADAVGGALVGLTFDDVKAAKGMDFSQAAQLVTHTFDGLTVTVRTVQQKSDYWATISAEAAARKQAAEKQASAINAKTSGWAYKLPPDKGQLLTTKLEALLKPLHPPTAPQSPPPAASPDDDSQE